MAFCDSLFRASPRKSRKTPEGMPSNAEGMPSACGMDVNHQKGFTHEKTISEKHCCPWYFDRCHGGGEPAGSVCADKPFSIAAKPSGWTDSAVDKPSALYE